VNAVPIARPPRRSLSRLVTVSEFAKQHGMPRRTAHSWLRRLDAQSGGKVLLRTGSGKNCKLYTTIARIQRADPTWVEEHDTARDDVDNLKRKYLEVELELRRVKSRVRELVSWLHDALGNVPEKAGLGCELQHPL